MFFAGSSRSINTAIFDLMMNNKKGRFYWAFFEEEALKEVPFGTDHFIDQVLLFNFSISSGVRGTLGSLDVKKVKNNLVPSGISIGGSLNGVFSISLREN